MRTLKFLSIALILIVGMILTIQSCQKDESFIQTESSIEKFNVKTISYNDFINTHNLSKLISSIDDLSDLDSDFQKLNSSDNSFSINTDNIIVVESDSTLTYSFLVDQQLSQNHTFENFIVEFLTENEYTFKLIGYTYNPNAQNENFPYAIEMIEIGNDAFDIQELLNTKDLYFDGECLWNYYYDDVCGCEYLQFLGCPVEDNVADGEGSAGSYSNGSSSSGSPFSGSYSGGSYGGSSSGGASYNGYHSPNNGTGYGINLNTISSLTKTLHLSTEEINFLDEHPDFAFAIAAFLDQHPNSPEANSFANFAVENRSLINSLSLVNGNLVLNLNNGGQLSLLPSGEQTYTTLTNLSQLESYLSSFNQISDTEFSVLNYTGTAVTNFKGKFGTSVLPVYINANDNSQLQNLSQPYNVTSLNTYLSGFTPGLSWSQNSFDVTSINTFTVKIDVLGTYDIGISIEGIDLQYNENHHLNLYLNKETGNAIDMTFD